MEFLEGKPHGEAGGVEVAEVGKQNLVEARDVGAVAHAADAEVEVQVEVFLVLDVEEALEAGELGTDLSLRGTDMAEFVGEDYEREVAGVVFWDEVCAEDILG